MVETLAAWISPVLMANLALLTVCAGRSPWQLLREGRGPSLEATLRDRRALPFSRSAPPRWSGWFS